MQCSHRVVNEPSIICANWKQKIRISLPKVLLCVLVAQSCLTLCDSMDCSPPESSVHRILPARVPDGLPGPLPGYLPDPGLNPHLWHCRQIPYHWATLQLNDPTCCNKDWRSCVLQLGPGTDRKNRYFLKIKEKKKNKLLRPLAQIPAPGPHHPWDPGRVRTPQGLVFCFARWRWEAWSWWEAEQGDVLRCPGCAGGRVGWGWASGCGASTSLQKPSLGAPAWYSWVDTLDSRKRKGQQNRAPQRSLRRSGNVLGGKRQAIKAERSPPRPTNGPSVGEADSWDSQAGFQINTRALICWRGFYEV